MKHIAGAKERVEEVLQLVGLAGYGERDTSQLSGGERQRVALARSLAPRPRLLMLDEPLGALDAALRGRLVLDLKLIIKQIGLTSLYVTHDQQEAFAIADRIGIMNAGRIEQVDKPEKLYWQPRTTFVARFLGLSNILPVSHYERGEATTPLGRFPLSEPADYLLLHPGGSGIVTQGGIEATILEAVFQGESYLLTLEHESGFKLQFNLSDRLAPAIKKGAQLRLGIAPDTIVPLVKSAD
jgi:ABC-type Fe3+/spermidine/putrescine transport system ATPase subunit